MTSARRYIWSEYVPYENVRAPRVVRALAEREVVPIVALAPHTAAEASAVVRAYRDAEARVGLWPLLDDRAGRWASAANAAWFCDHVRGLVDALAAEDALPDHLAIDLEPPIERMRKLVRGRWSPPPPGRGPDAAGHFRALVEHLDGLGMEVFAAVVPPVLVGSLDARRGWQRFLETPVDAIPFARVSTMAYTTLLEGYARGLVRRADARALLAGLTREARGHLGERASVSIGAVGTGALGDEKTYRSVAELAEDVAIVRAAGVDDIALFNLDGALARPPLEAWLDALVATPAASQPPPATWRAGAIQGFVRLVGHVAARLPGG
ncbi:hypothetical protein [Haliangium sp.]|uniref:hypothetical protein n=1 Tax=Haliangium sp. TaxID=2663208 RepID=UPI003D0C9F26